MFGDVPSRPQVDEPTKGALSGEGSEGSEQFGIRLMADWRGWRSRGGEMARDKKEANAISRATLEGHFE